ncbi:hypothetical protein Gohar_021475, partial [Gossypium harknessii]|nr:hypothetical protein [Gossypium harknessii]
MRGGKDKMSPMFPRLHVNVTNKGPKAPPQNKIALYEKLRFNDYLMVPTTAVSRIDQNCSCNQQSKGWGSFSKLNLSSLMQLHILDEKKMKGSDSVDLDSRRYAGNEFDRSEDYFKVVKISLLKFGFHAAHATS